MAKVLKFKSGSKIYLLEPIKLDRKKLYGWIERTALDENGEECKMVSLYPDEAIIIPKNGTAIGILDEGGKWVEKDDIIYVDQNGNPAQLVPSSFDMDIELKEKATVEDVLEHNITAVYFLRGDESAKELVNAISQDNEIYTFIFNYRTDYEGDRAFILENSGSLFILAGKKIEYEYIGLGEAGVIDDEDSEEEDEIGFDFSMM